MSELDDMNGSTGYEIAVIGMAGRFPGAASVHQFWENLKNGVESIRHFSDEELVEAGVPRELLENPKYIKAKGMLEDTDLFDASFFNYTLREAEVMDPQLRLLHQCSWTALEDSGYNPETYEGTIGFYAGSGTHYTWMSRLLDRMKDPSEVFGALSLNEGYAISTQIAYRLNLKGPALTIQTACSTSLVAIHTACQALLSGECDMALAGGVSVKLPAKNGYVYQEGMVFSPDGHCRAFDAQAAGCVEGNGVGIVVLKPLENAIEDRDHIYAVVKGTSVNNDGNRKVGYSAPSVKGQADVIQVAQQAAEVEPGSITYIEAHGTGTTLGDPVEMRALIRAFDTEERHFCRIGAVKTNLGHLDAAAGVTGFIKTVMSIYHRMIPPSLNFENPNSEIDFDNSPFVVNTRLHEWHNDEYPLRAGVSSFGIGGTNAHIILEEAPQPENEEQNDARARSHHLVLVSARSEEALERNTANLADYFKKIAEPGTQEPEVNFQDAVYTLQVGRKHFEYRRALVCENAAEAAELLSAGNSKKVRDFKIEKENPPLIFMFSGLGSQYVDMGLDLYENEPVFREGTDRCFEILEPLVGEDIKAVLYPGNGGTVSDDRINHPRISQLVIFVFEYALAKLLISRGLKPHAMIGYSFGEYVAACLAGVFSLEDVLKLVVYRGEAVARTEVGAMLSVPLSREELMPRLEGVKDVYLAIDNGPSCILSGAVEAIEALEEQLKQDRLLCMRLNSSHALHSPLMNSVLQEFEANVREMDLNEPQIPYISNVTGTWTGTGEVTDPGYWCKHLAQTVKFRDGVMELVKEPCAIFIELGPGRDLSAMVQRYMEENHHVVNVVRPQQMKVADHLYLLERVARLWLLGKNPDWNEFYGEEERRRLPLPTYSFDRQQFSVEGAVMLQASQQDAAVSYRRRGLLPEDYEAPRDPVEEQLTDAFSNIFGLDKIGINDDFFELGGDSLKVINLVTNIHKQLNVDVPMEAVFNNPTVKQLADLVGKKAESIYAAIPTVEKREFYPLTPPQLRVFIMEQIEEEGRIYNMPSVIWMNGPVDRERLEIACKGLQQRHEALRTGFFTVDGEPVQRVYDMKDLEFNLEYCEADEQVIPGMVEEFVQPFELARPPLWRVKLVKTAENKYLFMVSLHHIISDDISIGVLISELSALYRSETFDGEPVQFKDYAVWHVETEAVNKALEEQKQFWLDYFSGSLPSLELPLDFPRPEVQAFQGAHVEFTVDRETTDRLHDLARQNKTTLFVLMFTFYNVLLYRYTGQEDIIVGTPITGRSHRDVQEVVGMFVNTLALRNRPKGNKAFETFLQEVKEDTLDAFANQFYQFEDLVEALGIRRDMSRNPLFDTMFVLHTVDLDKVDIPGVTMSPYDFDYSISRFDITLNTAETARGLNLALEYNTALFKEETMERFRDNFKLLLETVVNNPQVLLDEVSLPELPPPNRTRDLEMDDHLSVTVNYNSKHYPEKTMDALVNRLRRELGKSPADAGADALTGDGSEISEEEKNRILYEFNDTALDYPMDKSLSGIFADRAAQNPDAIAVTGQSLRPVLKGKGGAQLGGGEGANAGRVLLSYGQLNERARRLALRLKTLGVGPGTVVAMLTDRMVEMLVAQQAILKTGAAYLPVDPEYPAERIRYMVEHTEAPVILATASELPFELSAQVVDINLEDNYADAAAGELPDSIDNRTPAYVIYTSGTTGIPKGVTIEHRSVVNFIAAIHAVVPFTSDDAILSLTTQGFDIFGLETLLPLSKGSRVVLGSVEEQLNAADASATMQREKVDIFQCTPSRLQLFTAYPEAAEGLRQLKYLIVGGEAFPAHLLEKARQLTPAKIYNVYGPTETTIWSSIKNVTGKRVLNIGKPLANTHIYIVGKDGAMQPVGEIGELCISGHGVALGYWKDGELTASKFVENPFVSPDDPEMEGYGLMYKTGDLARWLPDGNIEFLGRVDHQLKIGGYRIEPGEIENRLIKHDDIREAVVIPREDDSGEKVLCAYLITANNGTVPGLREYLAAELPYYMIPSYFIPVEEIPLSASGKVDRKALAELGELQAASTADYIKPQNALQKLIAEVWMEELSLEKVGIDDNFFDLGGTSKRVIRVSDRLKTNLNTNIPVLTMFRFPTIRLLADHLNPEEAVQQKKDRTDIKKKGRDRLAERRKIKSRRN